MTCNGNCGSCNCGSKRNVPRPGSDAARINGCTCPTVFNAGVNRSEFGYVLDPRCPVHGNGDNQ